MSQIFNMFCHIISDSFCITELQIGIDIHFYYTVANGFADFFGEFRRENLVGIERKNPVGIEQIKATVLLRAKSRPVSGLMNFRAVLAGELPVPAALAQQVRLIVGVAQRALDASSSLAVAPVA